ncbi:MAG TPA: hypothetical protein VJ577_08595 [Burkholderiaceae bacterium]|nr:hypothetical protein [Burkholderiaceae bacterium]
MSELRDVTVHVVDGEGSAVSSAAVAVVTADFNFPEVAMITNARGMLHFQVPMGSLIVRAIAIDEKSGEAMVARGKHHATVTIVVTSRP